MIRSCGLAGAVALALVATLPAAPARADNQTKNTSPVSLEADKLPYEVKLVRVATPRPLPTLQSFAVGEYQGLWVLFGGRTNGLHNFTNDPLKNFPPSDQNRRVWVIDPTTWKVWSRSVADSKLTDDQVDELSATATEHLQLGDTLYVVGGYGYQRSISDFRTFPTLTAIDLGDLVDWVRHKTNKDLSKLIRQTRDETLRVTGGEIELVGTRVVLAFGQNFKGGYGGTHVQTYTGQVRSFDIFDNGEKVRIANVDVKPKTPNYRDFRRRDYNLVPIYIPEPARGDPRVVALAGVFTLTDGIFTVPVEIDADGRPTMADPTAKGTFKQGMNGYSSAHAGIFDAKTGASHTLLFGGISLVTYQPENGDFVTDDKIPFTSQVTSVVRRADGSYRQFLVGNFPAVKGPDGDRFRFGADAEVFLAPETPVIGNGLIDLAELPKGEETMVGWVFGGIASNKGNDGRSVASNEVFEIRLTRR